MPTHSEQLSKKHYKEVSEADLFAMLPRASTDEYEIIVDVLWARHQPRLDRFADWAAIGVLRRYRDDLRSECYLVWSNEVVAVRKRMEGAFDPSRNPYVQFCTFIGGFRKSKTQLRPGWRDVAKTMFETEKKYSPIDPQILQETIERLHGSEEGEESESQMGQGRQEKEGQKPTEQSGLKETSGQLLVRLAEVLGLASDLDRSSLGRIFQIPIDDTSASCDRIDLSDLWRIRCSLTMPQSAPAPDGPQLQIPEADAGHIVVRRWRFWQNLVLAGDISPQNTDS